MKNLLVKLNVLPQICWLGAQIDILKIHNNEENVISSTLNYFTQVRHSANETYLRCEINKLMQRYLMTIFSEVAKQGPVAHELCDNVDGFL